ncbi:hypothetical protein ACA086_14835, partial [Muriicola sp. E247]|uniref:hypothetical protein n=1 Tax=Muriicola sp. E247 TaxID=3242730 RepID=UPI0035267DD2
PSTPYRSLKNPYFSVSGKNLGKVQKIIGERHQPQKPLTEKRSRLSAGSIPYPAIISLKRAIFYAYKPKTTTPRHYQE